MHQFIEDAVKGGWKFGKDRIMQSEPEILLDPKAWEAVGKTRWIEICQNPDHGFIEVLSFHDIGRIGCPLCGHDKDHIIGSSKDIWKDKMRKFLNHLIDGLSIEEALNKIK